MLNPFSGFDALDHIAYIHYLQQFGRLPLPNQGFYQLRLIFLQAVFPFFPRAELVRQFFRIQSAFLLHKQQQSIFPVWQLYL